MLISVLIGVTMVLAAAVESDGKQYKLISYGEELVREPRFRTMGAEMRWSDESSALPVTGDARWVVLRACPRREEAILGVIDANYNLTVQTWNGIGWSRALHLVNNTGSQDARFFDIAYESQSGNAVVVYGTDEGRSPRYRVWNGRRWSRERSVALPGDRSRPQYWVLLEPDSRSNQIVLVCQDDYRRLYSGVWNGTGWSNCLGEFDKSKTDNYLGFDVCRERRSGHVMVLWRPEEQPYLQYMFWDGSNWGPIEASNSLPLGTDAGMLEASADPQTNRIMVGIGDIHGDLALATWSGSAWSPFERIATNCRVVGENRSWDLMFESWGGRGLVVYSDGTSPELRYRMYDGGWSEELLGPTLNGPINVLELERDGLTREGLLLSLGQEKNLESMVWDGNQFSPPDQLETSVACNAYEPMASVFVMDRGPTVSLISPNGGERLEAGGIHLIKWQATQDLNGSYVDIYYTTSGSAGSIQWKPIVMGEVNRSEYPWMVPFEPSEQCLVKIIVVDESMNASSDVSDSLFTIYTNTGVDESRKDSFRGTTFRLSQNEPNPFTGNTRIRFESPGETDISLDIYDSSGRCVRAFSFVSVRGENVVVWDGTDDRGCPVTPGVYFACLEAYAEKNELGPTIQMILMD